MATLHPMRSSACLLLASLCAFSLTACEFGSASSGSETVPLVQSDGSARISIVDTKFQVDNQPIWLCGTNTPWDNWDDFGKNYDASFWDSHFADLHEAGINSSRVWILCSGDAGIQMDENGFVTGMTDAFWQDVDSLMALAAKHKIYIVATMMSFDCCKTGNRNHKKFRAMIQSKEATQSYLDNYVVPFCKRYDSNDYLFSIDLCNEPDWIFENAECGQIPWKPLVQFFASTAAAIHQNSDILVTTGIAMVRNNSDRIQLNYVGDTAMNQYGGADAYMDFYSVHFYDWMLPHWGNPFAKTPEEYGLDVTKPNVLGECSAKGSVEEQMDLCQAAQSVYDKGWDGIYPWTSNGSDDNGGFAEVSAYANQMLTQIPTLIFPS